jgi:hypothetical protein
MSRSKRYRASKWDHLKALSLSEAIARPIGVPVASEEKGETASQEA